jgi:hypothetical protein
MGSLGVHFAITRKQMQKLLDLRYSEDLDDDEVDEAIEEAVGEIEAKWDRKHLFETDKAWDPIHRALCEDNTPRGRINPNTGTYPLNLAIFGGRQLCEGEEYSISLVEPDDVRGVAKALSGVTEEWMRERFFKLKARATGYPITEEEFEYMWGNFQGLPEFFAKAAKAKRAVIFTVSH